MTDTPQSNPFTDLDPCTAGALPDLSSRRPGGVTAICIVAVVLGVLGLFSGTMKGVNVLFGAEMQRVFGSMGAVTPEQAKVQQEMQAAVADEMKPFAVANTILCVSQLVLCGALVYAGLKTLKLKAAGEKLLLAILVCLLLYEIGQLITVVLQQLSMGPIMELYMPQMLKSLDPATMRVLKVRPRHRRMSIIVGIIMQSGWCDQVHLLRRCNQLLA